MQAGRGRSTDLHPLLAALSRLCGTVRKRALERSGWPAGLGDRHSLSQVGPRSGQAAAVAPFRAGHANTRRGTAQPPRWPPRLAHSAPPDHTAPARCSRVLSPPRRASRLPGVACARPAGPVRRCLVARRPPVLPPGRGWGVGQGLAGEARRRCIAGTGVWRVFACRALNGATASAWPPPHSNAAVFEAAGRKVSSEPRPAGRAHPCRLPALARRTGSAKSTSTMGACANLDPAQEHAPREGHVQGVAGGGSACRPRRQHPKERPYT